MTSPSVRILHASDLHIAKQANITSPVDRFRPGTIRDAIWHATMASSFDPAILMSFADSVRKKAASGSIDAVILTGDLATTGSAADIHEAYEFLHAPSDPRNPIENANAKAKATLSKVNVPVWIIPGNHDHFGAGYLPDRNEFARTFITEWAGPVKSFPTLKKSGLAVTIIGADLSLNSWKASRWRRFGWFGQGRADEKILDELEKQTKLVPQVPGGCIIWAVHFPPIPKISRSLELLDRDLLVSRANKCGVKAILAGHTHEPRDHKDPGMNFTVYCGGTVSQAFSPKGHHFRIIEAYLDEYGVVKINVEDYLLSGYARGRITGPPGFHKVF